MSAGSVLTELKAYLLLTEPENDEVQPMIDELKENGIGYSDYGHSLKIDDPYKIVPALKCCMDGELEDDGVYDMGDVGEIDICFVNNGPYEATLWIAMPLIMKNDDPLFEMLAQNNIHGLTHFYLNSMGEWEKEQVRDISEAQGLEFDYDFMGDEASQFIYKTDEKDGEYWQLEGTGSYEDLAFMIFNQ